MPNSTSSITWDLTPYFPSQEGPEIEREVEELISLAQSLKEEFKYLAPIATGNEVEIALGKVNAFSERMGVARSYLYCSVAANSKLESIQKLQSRLLQASTTLSKAMVLFTTWIGDQNIEEVLTGSEVGKSNAYYLRRMAVLAKKQMSIQEEELAAEISPSATSAWARLHGNYTSQLRGKVSSEPDLVTMSQLRAGAYLPDREKRKTYYEAEIETWKENEVALAACLNGVKGWSIALSKRRGWASPLDEALFRSGIDREILNAMLNASRRYFPVLRKYLWDKAKLLGIQRCAFYDLFAPIDQAGKSIWNYDSAKEFVQDQFDNFSPRMGGLARSAFNEEWIDVYPRLGKRDGAFCSSTVPGRSLVLMNFKDSYNSVSTLAHELGHAYHNLCLADRTRTQSHTPMTLAETASTFAETICRKAVLKQLSKADSIPILEASLQSSAQIVLDITSRFIFESKAISAREKSELGAGEFCEIMVGAQQETYGDGLTGELHPYMWAAKPHYYGSDFYNFPYMFGLLFSLALYSVYEQQGESFIPKYNDLLSRCGMNSPAELASEFGFDLKSEGFWELGLSQMEKDANLFHEAVSQSN